MLTTSKTETPPLEGASITFEHVTFAYKQGEEVFRDATFSVPKGGMFFLTGASGAGKSSLLKLIYKANTNYLGSLQVMGQEMKNLTEAQLPDFRRKIGIVFQEFHLFDHLSTVDNVALPLTLAGETLTRARERASEMLSWLGLGSFLHKMPTILSGGQRQRVAMARAIINEPDILLADEPTGHVDDENAMKIMALFENFHKKGKTVILSTHNRAIIESLSLPELRLEKGTISVHTPASSLSITGVKKSSLKSQKKAMTTRSKSKKNPKKKATSTHKKSDNITVLKEVKNA